MKKRYFFTALVLAIVSVRGVRAEQPSLSSVVIAAVQTGQEVSLGNDFVVLHNTMDTQLDLTGWKLQYRSAAAVGTATWTTKRTIACVEQLGECRVVVAPHSNVVVSSYDLPGVPYQPLASGFSDSGGQLRIVRPGPIASQIEVVDRVGYGSAAESEGGLPADAPPVGQAIVRKQDQQGAPIDTDINGNDFTVGCYEVAIAEVPALCQEQSEIPEGNPLPVPEPTEPAGVELPIAYPQLFISELLPDPVSPATDSADEFIELHNPGSLPVDAKGYILQTGTDFRYQFTLGDVLVPAGGYVAIFAAESHLTLANGGTVVRLVDPGGAVRDTTENYGAAKSGQSWLKGGDGWQWSTTSTPAVSNVFTQLPPKVLAAATAVKKATKPTTKKAATSKSAKPAATKKTSKTVATATPATAASAQKDTKESGSIQYFVLGGIGLLIAAYVLYEYRQNITRFGRKLQLMMSRHKKAGQGTTLQMD